MHLHVTNAVSDRKIADHLANEGEEAMNVFAYLAEGGLRPRAKIIAEIAEGNSGSSWHSDVPNFLRDLADAIEAAGKS